jgi:hypothetical protein
MATFTNTSVEDLDVYVDGVAQFVAAGDSFDVPDEFADGFRQQPAFSEATTKKAAPVVTPAVPTPAPAAFEGDN